MKALVIGQGGREHAIVKALAQSPTVAEIHVIPGNDGMAKEALCHKIPLSDLEQIISLCLRSEIDFVFIGPEDPLVAGLAEQLRERGILAIGPNREAAQLEGSKIYAKQFMEEAQVPTAPYSIVQTVEQTLIEAKKYTPPYVLKADGLCAGKGVVICKSLASLKEAAEDFFNKKILGPAGEKALLEQFMPGWELSYLVLTNGESHETLPLAQDHKRLNDNNEGPNTGGMGTVAPLKIKADLQEKIEKHIIEPSIQQLKKKGLIYRGILFVGIMVTENGPQVLEYNVRLGDPETQVILPLIDGNIAQIFKQLAQGILSPMRVKNLYSCCTILAAEGYPQNPKRNVVIEGNLTDETPSSYFIHAGSKKNEKDEWVTNGGRVLGAVGIGSSLSEAIQNSYAQAAKAKWPGYQIRHDIGKYFTSST